MYGDCKISGAEYGIYANRIHLSGQDEQAKLTVTGDNTLAKPGTYFPKSEAMHLNYRSRIVSVSSLRTDFSVILRSTTNNTIYGAFSLIGSKNSILASADIDGADATEFLQARTDTTISEIKVNTNTLNIVSEQSFTTRLK